MLIRLIIATVALSTLCIPQVEGELPQDKPQPVVYHFH